MFSIKTNPLYRLFFFLSKKRKRQLYFLIFLLILNGVLESFSIASIVPFLSIIASPNDVQKVPGFGIFFQTLNIDDSTHFLFFFTVLFCIFIILSTFFRLFNLRYIIKLTANLEIELSRMIFKDNILQTYSNYSKKNSSNIISITVQKVSATATALCSLLILVGSTILGFFIVGSLLIINWKIVFSAICFLAIYYLIIYNF